MGVLEAITPNFAILKAWQNWVLVAVILFLVGTVFHLCASSAQPSSQET